MINLWNSMCIMDFLYAIFIYILYHDISIAFGEPIVVESSRETPGHNMAAPLLDPKVNHGLSPRKTKHKPVGCSMTCMRQMKQDIEDDEEFSQFILKQSKPYRFQSQFDETMLRKYCQKMNKTLNCVNPCPGGTVKTIATQALSLPKYMCIETRFFDYAPCFKRVTKRMEKICHSKSRCGEKKFELENLMNNPLMNADDVNKLVQSTCKYLSCYNECDQKEIIKDCGKMASTVMEGLLAKSIEVMKSMFETMRLPVEMPQECNNIMTWRLNLSATEDLLMSKKPNF